VALYYIKEIMMTCHVDEISAGYAAVYTQNMLFGLFMQG
jgi:hypothetical protein